MLSNIFVRSLISNRPIYNCQQYVLGLLSRSKSMSIENHSNNREVGIVKRFSKDKGYGFITKTNDGIDYFVHINGTGFKVLEQGQEVEFTIIQGEKGLVAKDVSVINAEPFGRTFTDSLSNDSSTTSRLDFGDSLKSQSSMSSMFDFGGSKFSSLNTVKQTSTPVEKSFNFSTDLMSSVRNNLFSSKRIQIDDKNKSQCELGLVKRWTTERGYGFIRRANGGPDLFCHVRSLSDGLRTLEEGQTVQFRVQQTNKGEEARDVVIFNEEPLENQQNKVNSTISVDEREMGNVRKWISAKGYGFLRRNTGGSDIFVHVRDLNNGVMFLEEGQLVEFDVIKNEKGEMAQNVTVHSEI